MSLYQSLSQFKRCSSESALVKQFKELAKQFIYGGYIKVNDTYRVYIRTVEFYYHDESDQPDAIKDPIMYHRNKPDMNVPYFPLMSLNAHQSGCDITFENEEQRFRASALIREYSVYDCKAQAFLPLQKNMRDNRSTFLFDYLNGFSLKDKSEIVWIDDAREPQEELQQGPRKGARIIVDGKKTDERDPRPWQFKLKEAIWLPTD